MSRNGNGTLKAPSRNGNGTPKAPSGMGGSRVGELQFGVSFERIPKRRRHLIAATVAFIVTTVFFSLEALLHYNIGKDGKLGLSNLPPPKEMLHIVLVVALFSFFSAVTTTAIQHALNH